MREPRQLDAAMAQKLSAGSVLPAAKRSDGSRNEKSKVLAAASPRAVDGRKACSSPPLLKVAPQSVETADHPGHGARPGGLRREIHGRLAGGSLQIHEIMIGDKDYPPYRLSLSVDGHQHNGKDGSMLGMWVQRDRKPNKTFWDWRSLTGELLLQPPGQEARDARTAPGQSADASMAALQRVIYQGRVHPGRLFVAVGGAGGGTSARSQPYSLRFSVEGRAGDEPGDALFCGTGRRVEGDSSCYEGDHWCGLRHGVGTATTKIGLLSGEWRLGQPYNAEGSFAMLCTKDGSLAREGVSGAAKAVFQGSFTLGRRGGERSSLTFQDGDRLVGSWSADGEFMEGTVRHTYTNGDAYDGGWRTTGIAGQKRGVRHGEGVLTRAGDGGDRLQGLWKDDWPWSMKAAGWWSGKRHCWWGEYRGDWEDGAPHGTGEAILLRTELEPVRFSGAWRAGQWCGDGLLALGPRSIRGTFRGTFHDCVVAQGFLEPGGGSFSGRLQEGKRTGDGVLHCSEGRYEGRFAGDEFEGEGNFVSADGTVEFRGSFARGRRHGPGYELRRGENGGVESFEGEWVEGERRRGILTAADGSKTKGTWANGCLDEALPVWRSCTIGDGSHWEGGWVGGQPHGKGVLTSAQGASLRGTFAKGALCPDKAAHADSVPHKGGTFDGSWRAGAPHGRGRLTYTSGAQLEGEWRGGEAHSCRGTLLLSGGHRFDGQVRSGAPDGRGSMRYANGARFEGTFRAGAPEDHGICFEPDGRRYEGQWHGGLRHGHGMVTLPTSARVSGSWARGALTASQKGSQEITGSYDQSRRQAAAALTPEWIAAPDKQQKQLEPSEPEPDRVSSDREHTDGTDTSQAMRGQVDQVPARPDFSRPLRLKKSEPANANEQKDEDVAGPHSDPPVGDAHGAIGMGSVPVVGCATALSDLLLLAGEIPSEKLLGLCLARVVT